MSDRLQKRHQTRSRTVPQKNPEIEEVPDEELEQGQEQQASPGMYPPGMEEIIDQPMYSPRQIEALACADAIYELGLLMAPHLNQNSQMVKRAFRARELLLHYAGIPVFRPDLERMGSAAENVARQQPSQAEEEEEDFDPEIPDELMQGMEELRERRAPARQPPGGGEEVPPDLPTKNQAQAQKKSAMSFG